MRLLPFAKIQRPAAVTQPAHDQPVLAKLLLTIDSQVLARLVRPLGHHQRPGHKRRHVARPAVLNRQTIEIDLIAFENDLLARRRTQRLRSHAHDLLEDRQLLPGILETFGRVGLLQESQQLAHLTQRFDVFLPHAHGHALRGTEQVPQHRHLATLDVLEQQRRPTGSQRAITDLGDLQVGIHLHRDTLQLTARLQRRDEVPQIVIFHGVARIPPTLSTTPGGPERKKGSITCCPLFSALTPRSHEALRAG